MIKISDKQTLFALSVAVAFISFLLLSGIFGFAVQLISWLW